MGINVIVVDQATGTECPRATFDDEGRIANADVAIGEIVSTSGAAGFEGYWRNEEAERARIRDGWYWTGDLGYRDAHANIFLVDRAKDMIVTGGENVYSVEVENAITQHPAVAQCAVIGIPDEQWGELVHAVVVTKPGAKASANELIEFCKTLIAGYKCPRSADISERPLPLSGAGKVLKRDLRKPFWESKGRKVN
jgi:long-chain acyl-CoA synthetase